LAGRAGKAKAITAAARKLAVLVDLVLSANFTYQDPGCHSLPPAQSHP